MNTLILTLMLLLVPAKAHTFRGETEEHALARYTDIASAIETAADGNLILAMFLTTVARHESSYRLDIHNGDTRGDRNTSWGLFQIQCGNSAEDKVPETDYRAGDIIGTDLDSTMRAADAAATHLRTRIRKCGARPMCVFRMYGGVGINPKPEVQERLEARVATYQRLSSEAARRQKRKTAD